MSKEVTSTSFDSQLDTLGHVNRRRLLFALLNAEEVDLPIGIDQIASEAAERDVLLSMHHVHLPKLEDRGFVDANMDLLSVTRGPRFDEIKPLLELLDTNRDQLPADWA